MNYYENSLSYILNLLHFKYENENEFLDYALKQTLKLINSKFGFIYLYYEEKKEFVLNIWTKDIIADSALLNPQKKIPLEKSGILGEVARYRKEIIINSIETNSILIKEFTLGQIEIKNFISIPIFENDKIIAVVCIANKEKDYEECDVANLKLYMNITFQELERIKITKKLEIEKQWSQNIINEATVIIVGLANKTKIVLFNKFAEEFSGYKAEEVIGKDWIEIFIGSQDKEKLYNLSDSLFVNKIKSRNQNYIITKDGSRKLINWNNVVLKGADNNDYIISIGLDITDQFEAEENLQIQNKRLLMLLDIGATLIQSQSLDEVFNNISFSVSKFVDNISVAVYSIKGNYLYLNSTFPTLPNDFPQDLRYANLYDHPHIKDVLDSKKYLYIEDLKKENLTYKEKEVTKFRNLNSIIYLPLFYEEKLFGVLLIGRQEKNKIFSKEEIYLFEILARFASIKIEDLNTHIENLSYIEKLENLNKKQIELLTKLHQSEERFRRLFENAQDIIYRYDFLPKPHFTYVNEVVTTITGYTPQEHYNDPQLGLKIVHPEDRKMLEKILNGNIDEFKQFNIRWINKNGQIIYIEQKNVPIYDENKNLIAIECIARDITQRIKIEKEKEELRQQLLQSQKIESIGMLAGGIAHDYNNMLAIILGYAQDLQSRFNEDDPIQQDIKEIIKAAQVTKDLTNQLLAFARKQPLSPKLIDLNQLLKSMESLIRRTLREDISIEMIFQENIESILVDPIQMQQIILNLIVNAKDAMSNGGKIIIETKNVEITQEYINSHLGINIGKHVMLAISDTGHGMDKATMDRIFEPFFSSKETGKGTGLGLSTVYGIVKQSGGNIWVYSEIGKGTTFKIYFPASEGKITETSEKDYQKNISGKGQKIMLVEDEEDLRKILNVMLVKLGYEVIITQGATDALTLIEEKGVKPDCVLTDLIMPEMNGKELIDRIKKRYDDIKVLYMSGYTDNVIVHHGILDEKVNFIQKPFLINELGQKLKGVFDKI